MKSELEDILKGEGMWQNFHRDKGRLEKLFCYNVKKRGKDVKKKL